MIKYTGCQLTTSDNIDKRKIEVISLESHSCISNNSKRILTICRETLICMLSVGLFMYKLQRLKVIQWWPPGPLAV